MVRTKRLTNPHGQQQHIAAHSAVVPPANSPKRLLQEEELEELACPKSGRLFINDCDDGNDIEG